MLHFLRRVNRVVTNLPLSRVAWAVPPLAIVHHEGCKRGHRDRALVVAIRGDGRFVIPGVEAGRCS